MKKFGITVVCFFVVAFLTGAHHVGAQQTCDPQLLAIPCGLAFSGMRPSTRCCNKLREQQPCYCAYLNNPDLKGFVDSPAARRIARDCNITIPTQAECPASPA
ncbi:hypothetical protein SDJN03_21749, partial [Cucurbita argyrosperma subsp. sororia]